MLKVFDGYDHYNAAADMQARTGFLNYAILISADNALSWVTGQSGSDKAARFTTTKDIAAVAQIYADRNAAAFYGQYVKLSNGAEFQFYDGAAETVQCSVLFDPADRAIRIYRGTSTGGTLLYASDAAVWSLNTWFMLEIGVVIGLLTSGSVLVRINQTPVAGVVNTSTQMSANAWFGVMNIVARKATAGSVTIDLDDLYYCDTVADPGPLPLNTFLGIARVETLFANGNDAVQFTPLSGTNYEMIDEVAMDSDVTYNYSATYEHQDSFNFGALAVSTATILGVQVTMAARKDDAGVMKMRQFLKLSTEEAEAPADVSMADTYRYFSDLWTTNVFNDQLWSVAAVNLLSAGYKQNTPPGYGMVYGEFYG